MVKEVNIPDRLIINIDEIGLAIMPVCSYTLEVCGKKQVPATGDDNKCQITVVEGFGTWLSKSFLHSGHTRERRRAVTHMSHSQRTGTFTMARVIRVLVEQFVHYHVLH